MRTCEHDDAVVVYDGSKCPLCEAEKEIKRWEDAETPDERCGKCPDKKKE